MKELGSATSRDAGALVKRSAGARTAVGVEASIVDHQRIGPRYMELVLRAPLVAERAAPGQFVMISVSDGAAPVLPRPMAIFSAEPAEGIIRIVYAIVGGGTRRLSERPEGDHVYVLGPLGNGFELPGSTRSILLVGRGIGTCSLTSVAPYSAKLGIRISAVVSARRKSDLVGVDFYLKHGVENVYAVTDEDGNSDPGKVSELLQSAYGPAAPDLILTCGSRRLTDLCERLADNWECDLQVSIEAQMACGLGFCQGCASSQVGGPTEAPLVCTDGPVFALNRNNAMDAAGNTGSRSA